MDRVVAGHRVHEHLGRRSPRLRGERREQPRRHSGQRHSAAAAAVAAAVRPARAEELQAAPRPEGRGRGAAERPHAGLQPGVALPQRHMRDSSGVAEPAPRILKKRKHQS